MRRLVFFPEPMVVVSFVKELLWKFPSRKDSVGIPFRGVMHNSGLCGGSWPCHGTDQKQIKETEKTTIPIPPPPPRKCLTALPLTWLVIFLTALCLRVSLTRYNDTKLSHGTSDISSGSRNFVLKHGKAFRNHHEKYLVVNLETQSEWEGKKNVLWPHKLSVVWLRSRALFTLRFSDCSRHWKQKGMK